MIVRILKAMFAVFGLMTSPVVAALIWCMPEDHPYTYLLIFLYASFSAYMPVFYSDIVEHHKKRESKEARWAIWGGFSSLQLGAFIQYVPDVYILVIADVLCIGGLATLIFTLSSLFTKD